MRVLSVDPAIRNTGFAIVEGSHQSFRSLDFGVISIPQKIPQSGALAAIRTGISNLHTERPLVWAPLGQPL